MELNEQLAEHFGVTKDHGVLITRVVEKSPAREVGLKAGDVILSINGDRVRDADHLRRLVRAAGEDSECQVKVMRDGKERAFEVRLGDSGDFGAGWTPRGDFPIDLPGLRDIHEGHRLHGGDGVFELNLEGLEGLEDLPLKLDLLRDNLDGLRIQINGHDWDEEDMHEALEKAQRALEKARRKLEQNLQDDDN